MHIPKDTINECEHKLHQNNNLITWTWLQLESNLEYTESKTIVPIKNTAI